MVEQRLRREANAAAEWRQAANDAMDRYSSGDASAFAELYDCLAPRLARFVSRSIQEAEAVDDIVQQTFLQMHAARCHFTSGTAVAPWAFAIARNLTIDLLRRSWRELTRRPEGDEVPGGDDRSTPVTTHGLDDVVAARRLARGVEQQLARMTERRRAIFELVYADGLSMQEAADVLGTTLAAVKASLNKTHAALREALGDQVRDELGG